MRARTHGEDEVVGTKKFLLRSAHGRFCSEFILIFTDIFKFRIVFTTSSAGRTQPKTLIFSKRLCENLWFRVSLGKEEGEEGGDGRGGMDETNGALMEEWLRLKSVMYTMGRLVKLWSMHSLI